MWSATFVRSKTVCNMRWFRKDEGRLGSNKLVLNGNTLNNSDSFATALSRVVRMVIQEIRIKPRKKSNPDDSAFHPDGLGSQDGSGDGHP